MDYPVVTASCRAVLFDLDDTLMDHQSALRDGVDEWCTQLGLPTGQHARFLQLEKKWFAAYERGEVSHAQQRAGRCREFLGRPELSDTAALEAYAGYLAAYRRNWRPFADALPVLHRALAAGVQVGVLTNGTQQMQQAKLQAGGLELEGVELFATVEMGAPKPQPQAYLHACERLGVAPAQTLMVGDSLANDVEGARAAGLQALHLCRARSPEATARLEATAQPEGIRSLEGAQSPARGGGVLRSLDQLRFA
ncbi:HAD family hydrolase [Corynebacterium lizhenjunii]|uniref:HAD family hydrolase n=1 Tax=Corynebacterium lizhenjunii TaxID=2709394 RepID=A0A7T0KF54_9CORY|nr:HAD family hydrolase [Corynebacterium lizhenjunii]QPK79196.1 HAD family hydrolase [Corynebacterium lizhenjunii]